ncbi:hypothetical protein NJ7G_2768 [Natrinema sp. J7-2]|nr:hypothetical protein NJ7G_2768 [Natrinema sp. J7-2]
MPAVVDEFDGEAIAARPNGLTALRAAVNRAIVWVGIAVAVSRARFLQQRSRCRVGHDTRVGPVREFTTDDWRRSRLLNR